MNSWEIIKTELTKKSRPGTFGRSIALNEAADLFLKLLPKLSDRKSASETMDIDGDLREALLARPRIEELREIGVIS